MINAKANELIFAESVYSVTTSLSNDVPNLETTISIDFIEVIISTHSDPYRGAVDDTLIRF